MQLNSLRRSHRGRRRAVRLLHFAGFWQGVATLKEAGVIRMTRLPGPTAREVEVQAAEYIERAAALCDGRNLGARKRRDGRDGSGLRVDFTYDVATPPVAIEITALVEPSVMALGTELLKLETKLQEIVSSEELGAWLLGIRVGANIRDLRQPPVDLLRRYRGRNGVAIFTADKAPEDMTDGDLRLLAELFDLGLASAGRSDEGNELSIFPPIVNAQEGDDGFGTLLQTAMAANVDKLREARPRETHLVVTLDHPDLSPNPVGTPQGSGILANPALMSGSAARRDRQPSLVSGVHRTGDQPDKRDDRGLCRGPWVRPHPNCSMALMCCGSCLRASTRNGRTACGERRQVTVDGIFCGTPSASRPRSIRHARLMIKHDGGRRVAGECPARHP